MKRLILALLGFAVSVVEAQRLEYRVQPAEAQKLMQEYLIAILPTKPENGYFTPFMKEKIRLTREMVQNGSINLVLDTHDLTPEDDLGLMYTTWSTGKPTIGINVSRMWLIIKTRSKGTNPEINKNTFALALIHEAVHLERGGRVPRNADSLIAEEMRAWYKTNMEAVRPLRKSNHPLDKQFILIDDVLIKCRDKMNCKAFRDLLLKEGSVRLPTKGRP